MIVISEDYRKQQSEMHADDGYGVSSVYYAPMVAGLVNDLGVTEMLDYGCGKGRLAQHMRLDRMVSVRQYDPAIAEFAEPPEPNEFVACIDVLEHIEPDLLESVLDDLARVTLRHGVFTVHTGPARRMLPDGRNAHLIQEDADFWLPKIMQRFRLNVFKRDGPGFLVWVKSR